MEIKSLKPIAGTKPLNKKTIIFLGAGFDSNFGLLTFKKFFDKYLIFIKNEIISNNHNDIFTYLDYINKCKATSIFKKFDYINEIIFLKYDDHIKYKFIENKEIVNNKIVNFFDKNFNLRNKNNVLYNKKNIYFTKINIFQNMLCDYNHFYLVTTNFSNTLSYNEKLQATIHVDDLLHSNKSNLFLCIHGNVEINITNLIYKESQILSDDYLGKIVELTNKILNDELNEIIFYGYSFMDSIILNKIINQIKILTSKNINIKVTIYLLDTKSNKMENDFKCNYYRIIFFKNINYQRDANKKKLFDKFIKYIESNLNKSYWNCKVFDSNNEINFIKDENELSYDCISDRINEINMDDITYGSFCDFIKYIKSNNEISTNNTKSTFFLFYILKLNKFLKLNMEYVNYFLDCILQELRIGNLIISDFYKYFFHDIISYLPYPFNFLKIVITQYDALKWNVFNLFDENIIEDLIMQQWFIKSLLDCILFQKNFNLYFKNDIFTCHLLNLDTNYTKLDYLLNSQILDFLKDENNVFEKDIQEYIKNDEQNKKIKCFLEEFENMDYCMLCNAVIIKNIAIALGVFIKLILDEQFKIEFSLFDIEQKMNSQYLPLFLSEKNDLLKEFEKNVYHVNIENWKLGLMLNKKEISLLFRKQFEGNKCIIEEYNISAEYENEIRMLKSKHDLDEINFEHIIEDKFFPSHFVDEWLHKNWCNIKIKNIIGVIKDFIEINTSKEIWNFRNIDEIMNYLANRNISLLLKNIEKTPTLILGVGIKSLFNEKFTKSIKSILQKKPSVLNNMIYKIEKSSDAYNKHLVCNGDFINQYFGRAINLIKSSTMNGNAYTDLTKKIMKKIKINNFYIKSYLSGFIFGLSPYFLNNKTKINEYNFFEGLLSNVNCNKSIISKINFEFINRLFSYINLSIKHNVYDNNRISHLIYGMFHFEFGKSELINFLFENLESIKFDLSILFNSILTFYVKCIAENIFFKCSIKNNYFYISYKTYIFQSVGYLNNIYEINIKMINDLILNEKKLINKSNMHSILNYALNKQFSIKNLVIIFLNVKNNSNEVTKFDQGYGINNVIEKSLDKIKLYSPNQLSKVMRHLAKQKLTVKNKHKYMDY